MKKILLEINLEPSAWEVIETRAKRSYEEFKKEAQDIGEEFTFDDAVKNELLYIIDKDIEMYDVYDDVRQSTEVQHAIRQEVAKAAEKKKKKAGRVWKEEDPRRALFDEYPVKIHWWTLNIQQYLGYQNKPFSRKYQF